LIQTLIIFLSSFLIDVDHYLIFIFNQNSLSLKKAHKSFLNRRRKWIKLSNQEKEKYKRHILIFHGIEFIIILLILSFYIPIFKFILIGILIHLTLDYIDIFYFKDKLYSKVSQFYVILTNKRKKDF
jgi:hypothetical protein